MGRVLVTARLFPEGVDVNLEEIKNEIKEKIKPERIEEEPIAFGLVALKVEKIIEDEGEAIRKFEENLKRINKISQAEIIQVSRVFL